MGQTLKEVIKAIKNIPNELLMAIEEPLPVLLDLNVSNAFVEIGDGSVKVIESNTAGKSSIVYSRSYRDTHSRSYHDTRKAFNKVSLCLSE